MIESVVVAVILGAALWFAAREIRLGLAHVAPVPMRMPWADRVEKKAIESAQATAQRHVVVEGKPYRRPVAAVEGSNAEVEWLWAIDIDRQRGTGMVSAEDEELATEILSRA